jgi:co-chaperonin GroES (HSP10)
MTASSFAALKAKRRRRPASSFPTPRRKSRRKVIPIDLKPGDRVLFGKWSGTEVKIDDEELLIMKESDVMGVLEGAKASRKVA